VKRIGLNTDEGRHAAWLELFLDLVYVVALARLTHIVVEGHNGHVEPRDYLIFFVLFVPAWWSWVGHTMYANRFGTYDITDRLLTLLQMFFAVMLALGITDALGETRAIFALAYAATRWTIILMYARIYFGNPDARPVAGGLIVGFSIGSSLWAVSVLFPPPIMFTLWFVGIVIELATPLSIRKELKLLPVHSTHLPERVGLFALLVLGESIQGLASGASNLALSLPVILNLFLAFSVICLVWWLYFETLEKTLTGHLKGAAQLCIYGHLPIYMGIVLLAAGVQKLVSADHSTDELNLIFSFSFLLILMPLQLIHYQYIDKSERTWFLKRGVLIVASILTFFVAGQYIGNTFLVLLIIIMLVVYTHSESTFIARELKNSKPKPDASNPVKQYR